MMMGADAFGPPGTDEKGLQVLRKFLTDTGINPISYQIVDGSGLDGRNEMTPRSLVRVLERMYGDFRYQPEFVASLSIGGVDGTERERFRHGPDLPGRTRLKVGFLYGVSTLSGYLETFYGDIVAFSMMMDKFDRNHFITVENLQDKICQTLGGWDGTKTSIGADR